MIKLFFLAPAIILSIGFTDTAKAQSIRIYTENFTYTTDDEMPKKFIDDLIYKHKAALDGYIKECAWEHNIDANLVGRPDKFELAIDSYCNFQDKPDFHAGVEVDIVGWVYFQKTDTEEFRVEKIEALKSRLGQISEYLGTKLNYTCAHEAPTLGHGYRNMIIRFKFKCPSF